MSNKKVVFSSISFLVLLVCSVFIAVSLRPRANTDTTVSTIHINSTEIAEVETEHTQTNNATEKKLIEKPIKFTELVYTKFYKINSCVEHLKEVSSAIATVNIAISSNDFTDAAKLAMQNEVARLYDIAAKYQYDIDTYRTWAQEYYYAAKVWEFLKQNNYSDAAACGIIGNMMVETGGYTLDLKPTIYSKTGKYYGLCQWSKDYYPEVIEKSFEYQLDFLEATIAEEFRVFGNLYKANFTYEDFKNMSDPGEAALAFAKVYERCYSNSFYLRQQGAQDAYDYFVD